MQLIFFFPEIYRLSTGGNVFNKHLLRHFKKYFTIKKVIVNRNFRAADFPFLGIEDNIWLVDSLLLHYEQWPEFLMSQPQQDKFLLLHYLNLFDPSKWFSGEARKEALLLPIFTGFIATSQYSQQCLLRQGIDPQQIAVIRPGIEQMNFPAQRSKFNEIPRLLTVSSIFPGKGLLEMIGLMEKLTDLKWRWDIIGEDQLDPSFTQFFRERLNASAIAGRVKIHSPRKQKELFSMYARSDIFMLPSHFETCSMVTMEAMASGLPVIAWQVGGIPELVEHQRTGYLIPYQDEQFFLEKLRELIVAKEIRQRLATASKSKSISLPKWEQSAGKLKDFIQGRTNR
ncbi:MAG: hypothetical protein A2Y94_13130 [Caldithrix sp. RBG_13_44_9]|nr:MAG: hypothetical protein A2Y94_13130 [Caldithrix sp. RBG_13_44_9]